VTLYVDDAIWRWQGLHWAHLLADDIDELHCFAAKLGIHLLSYQGPPRTSVPHYDLTAYERRRAIACGQLHVAGTRSSPLRAGHAPMTASRTGWRRETPSNARVNSLRWRAWCFESPRCRMARKRA
jgi:Protein of unknown function (DUF4031)